MSSDSFDMDDLLGAYALDAVDEDERRAVEEYLASNPRARAEVQEHREVATMLAWSGMDAPEGLWDKIATSMEGQARPEADTDLGKVLAIGGRSRRRWARTIGAWAAASAAAAVIAVAAVNISRDEGPTGVESAAMDAFADPSLHHAQLVNDAGLKVIAVVDDEGVGYLRADDLPPLDAQRTYQLWGQVGDQMISLGLLGRDPNLITFTATDDISLLAITDEDRGGVTAPTSAPIVAGALA